MRTWLKIEPQLVNHPKTKRLARLWGCPPYAVVGFLVAFWGYLVEFKSDGQAAEVPPEDLEELAAPCQQRALTVHLSTLDALKETGFVDPDGRVHDWEVYTGALLTRRERDRERKRTERKVSAGQAQERNGTSVPRVEQSRAETETTASTPADLLEWIPEGYHPELEARLRSSHSPVGLIAELRLLRKEPELRNLKAVTGEHVGQAIRDAGMKGAKLSGKTLANFIRVAQSAPLSGVIGTTTTPVTPIRRATSAAPRPR